MNTYEAFYKCANCFFVCVVEYPKGTMTETTLDCPNCGCGWLQKTFKTGEHEFANHFDVAEIKEASK